MSGGKQTGVRWGRAGGAQVWQPLAIAAWGNESREQSAFANARRGDCMKKSVVKIFAGSGIRLAVLTVLLLGMAGVCTAQASAAAARSAAQAAPNGVAPQAGPAPQAAQSGRPVPRGTSEGIKVHGHWTIEVRNPDGTVATHREFENSLAGGSGTGNGGTLISALLSRTLTPGSWLISLQGKGGAELLIAEPGSPAAAACTLGAQSAPSTFLACSTTLSVTGPQIAGGTFTGSTVTLAGNVMVPSSSLTPISAVTTSTFPCNLSTGSSPSACAAATGSAGQFDLTLAVLSGSAAVPVTGGQLIAVTVVISFQ